MKTYAIKNNCISNDYQSELKTLSNNYNVINTILKNYWNKNIN